ncbi:MAG: pyruvate kinase [Planctomycetota bacterium]
MSPLRVIVTVPPHADFLEEVAAHPLVGGLRLNTVMPLRDGVAPTLERLAALGQPLWVDLKGRQLRVAEPAVPPFGAVRLSHRIEVETPCLALFGNGEEEARVLAVDGDRLILEDGPRRVLGPGESVNIPDASLRVHGRLTARDEEYLAAMRALGLRRVMLSFVEEPEDLAAVRDLLPDAELVAKIESRAGLGFAPGAAAAGARLMAARGDLFLEVRRPHHILRALRQLLAADPDAIAASRICDSLAWQPEPSSQDLSDVAYLLTLGYRTLMLGDEVCLRRDSVIAALNLIEAIARDAALLGGSRLARVS